MGANSFYPQPLLFLNKQLKPGTPVLSLREIAYWPSPFGIQKNPCKFTYLSIRADGSRGNRTPLNGYAAGRTKNGDGNESSQSSDGKVSSSSNNEAIISLVGRIKSSISKREAVRTKKRNPSSSDKPKVQSVSDVLFQPRKEVKVIDTRSIKDVPKEEQKIQDNEPVADIKLSRLPSNFVKRSPIPSPSAPRDKRVLNYEPSASKESTKHLELPRVEELKLPQLKELAKARGIKGYSRMKKSELINKLRS
ncbi:hypothetical protein CICLE_v10016384mg [Citrus x clementina]|uniref:Rho termination factor-like N-terminal domain-containing protein n=1 Tax=Citrus clementina TaxID=85681 RepID=V4W941_CITCL|nr:SAP-like protein BP-73 [Citrus x clementina]ESR62774.1 hypothetical protein CICLE_v10016384mg [Citrus x clementina]GAY34776.1 hypothetical protein CUMW_013280 [Citrus unshiu]